LTTRCLQVRGNSVFKQLFTFFKARCSIDELKKKFPAYHSHGYGDPHEAEGEEDDDVPVLAVLDKGEG
jgi:hypothetical protein